MVVVIVAVVARGYAEESTGKSLANPAPGLRFGPNIRSAKGVFRCFFWGESAETFFPNKIPQPVNNINLEFSNLYYTICGFTGARSALRNVYLAPTDRRASELPKHAEICSYPDAA